MSDFTTTRPLGSTGGYSLRLFDSLLAWNDRRVTRNELHRLSDRELADIGLSRAEIDTVVERLR
ncbi:MAG: DUF1127 domain-containing protein [Alkalilacustris sp.]